MTDPHPDDRAPAALSDRELVTAYERTSGAPGDPTADSLLAEIEARDLDL